MTAARPTAPDPRIQLALSVLEHARGQTPAEQARAIDRAVLALQGASIDEIRRMTL